jgi:hypothetical protein
VTLARNTGREVVYDHPMRGLGSIVAFGFACAACGKDAGVQISVSWDATTFAGMTSVRLYAGTGSSVDRTMLMKGAPLVGTSWNRDVGFDDDAVILGGAQHANFFIQPADNDGATIPMLIAVGFKGEDAVAGFAQPDVQVPKSGYVEYPITLDANNGVPFTWDERTDKTSPAAQTSSTGKCVSYDGNLIVSENDQDCDADKDGDPKECSPDVWNTDTRNATLDELNCLTRNSNQTLCFGGGPTCTDGTGPSSTCAQSGYCTAAGVCSCTDFACVRAGGPAGSATTFPRFSCQIPALKDPATGTQTLCPVTLLIPSSNTIDCSAVNFRTDQQNFLPSVTAVSATRDILITAGIAAKCHINLVATGTVSPPQGVTTPDPLVTVMAVDTGVNAGFLIPVVFTTSGIDATQGCPTNATAQCHPVGPVTTADAASVCAAGNAMPDN